jgi:hypothetical protein
VCVCECECECVWAPYPLAGLTPREQDIAGQMTQLGLVATCKQYGDAAGWVERGSVVGLCLLCVEAGDPAYLGGGASWGAPT